MSDIDQPPRSRMLAVVRWASWLAVAIIGVGTLAFSFWQPAGNSSSVQAAEIGGPFALTAPDGTTVTDKTLAGKPFAIFFGFTRCPDVCPTSLSRMARLRKELGPDGMAFNIVFVSVDPEHDKPGNLGSFVELFGTPIIGLTGTEPQLAQIKQGYKVFSAKVPQPGGDYTIDHTAAIYLMSATGEFAGTIGYQESDAEALEKLKRLIK